MHLYEKMMCLHQIKNFSKSHIYYHRNRNPVEISKPENYEMWGKKTFRHFGIKTEIDKRLIYEG